MRQAFVSLSCLLVLLTTSATGAYDLVESFRLDYSAQSFRTFAGKVYSQEIADPERFRQGVGFLSLPTNVDASTVYSGIRLGRVINGTPVWMDPTEYILGFITFDDPVVAMFPFEGWETETKYAIQLRRSLTASHEPLTDGKVVIVFEVGHSQDLVAPQPDPTTDITFDPRRSSFHISSGELIEQDIGDQAKYSPGAALLTLPGHVDIATIENGILLGRIDERHLSWLGFDEYALSLIASEKPTVAILPFAGWERGVEYAIRIKDRVKDNRGQSINRNEGNWVLEIEDLPPAVKTQTRAQLPRKAALAGVGPNARFPGGQNILWKGGWTDPSNGLMYFRGRWYDPRTGYWLSPDPLGPIDSPNLYAGFAWQPHFLNDPMGLTSRTHVKQQIIYYTWNFGWVDTRHAYEYPGLATAWNALRQARPGEIVPFSLEMNQKEPGHPFYKQTEMDFAITAAGGETQRKQQLLYAFQQLAENFETYQGEGVQGSQAVNTLLGIFVTHEEEKIASSFSTEDLFSNLLAFHTTVDGTSIKELVRKHGGSIDHSERKDFSLYVWDYLLKPRKGGQTEWAPVHVDPDDLLSADEIVRHILRFTPRTGPAEAIVQEKLRELVGEELTQFQEMLAKYQEKYGEPTLPDELLLQPLAEGVEITNVQRQ